MATLETVRDFAAGIGTVLVLLIIFGGLIYRTLSGKFLIPKREIILPNQNGVVVMGDRTVRVAGPGACWVRPKQRLVLCDMRPRPLRMVGSEILGSDLGIVRISLGGSYRVSDPASYYISSANSADEVHLQLQRVVVTSARELPSGFLVSDTNAFSALILERLAPSAAKLGLEVTELNIWESIAMGFVRREQSEVNSPSTPASGLVH